MHVPILCHDVDAPPSTFITTNHYHHLHLHTPSDHPPPPPTRHADAMVLQDLGRRINAAVSDLTRAPNLDEKVRAALDAQPSMHNPTQLDATR